MIGKDTLYLRHHAVQCWLITRPRPVQQNLRTCQERADRLAPDDPATTTRDGHSKRAQDTAEHKSSIIRPVIGCHVHSNDFDMAPA